MSIVAAAIAHPRPPGRAIEAVDTLDVASLGTSSRPGFVETTNWSRGLPDKYAPRRSSERPTPQ
ncbi:MAG: hypothetical protein JWM85_3532 [Acidimicrobiaceae bacterium]|nr:hypothetical protein [Acidimicrobiaceae bacterium]